MYLDSNVFIHAILNNQEKGKRARKIISELNDNRISASTSILAFDEAILVIMKNRGGKKLKEYWEAFLKIPNLRILDMNRNVALKVGNYLELGFKPADSIHLAIMFENGIDTIISDDKHFDNIKGITRKCI
ncbi:type II toxin-antitoxin system VapC family toxin [Candidatus Micrarchaeota archaeon]|nr:type II toxin-antitoxin system VapC family toxin [Candidatus Micrarchaeota archaeon]